MIVRNRRPRAGHFAQNRYEKGLRAWRSLAGLLFVFGFSPFLAGGLALLLVDGHPWSWIGGMLAGAAIGAWLALRETPPPYVEHWRDGAEGERKTERALESLSQAGFQIVHEVDCKHGNYDHIAVGPAGVFLLDSKKLGGIVEVRAGMPRLRRRLYPDRDERCDWIRSRALAAAARLNREIQNRTGQRAWVQAVVVLWCEFPQQIVEDQRCVLLHGSRVADWLSSRPRALDADAERRIADAVRSMASENSTPHAPTTR